MGWVLNDNTTVDGRFFEEGTAPPAEFAALVGEHLRREISESEAGSQVDEVVSSPAPIVLGSPGGDGTSLTAPTPPAETGQASPADSGDQGKALAEVPPKGGPGSGKDAWAAYAQAHGVKVEAGAGRDDIIAALDAADVPTEPTE